MTTWREVRLDEVADVTVGHVGPMATEYLPSGVPFLRSQNIQPLRLGLEGVKFISEAFTVASGSPCSGRGMSPSFEPASQAQRCRFRQGYPR